MSLPVVEVRTPARLHFGLLAYSRDDRRQFGGAGLMIHRPDFLVRVSATDEPGVTGGGRMGDRAQDFAQRFLDKVREHGWSVPFRGGLHIEVLRVPRPHTGLGTGTQIALAVARGIAHLLDRDDLSANDLANFVGRGQRSAIGAYGFFHGGFIVEGGKSPQSTLSPLLMSHPFPEDWRIVLLRPRALEGIAGERELHAFAQMPSIPADVTAEMCRLLLLGLVPAMIERDIDRFGEALFQLQQRVGECFAAAQGGIYADPLLEQMVNFIRGQGVRGVGQSSWGPSLYAVVRDDRSGERLAAQVRSEFQLNERGEALITAADNHGGSIRRIQ